MNRKFIKEIVIDALFLALIVIFSYVPYIGLITIGPISFTTIHLIVLIAGVLFGTKKGTLVGFFFGLFSLFVALTRPGTFDYFCINPFISILPRVLFGFLSGFIFDLIKKHVKEKTFYIICGPVAFGLTLVHTTLFLLSLYLFGFIDILGISGAMGLTSLIEGNANSVFISLISWLLIAGALVEAGVAFVVTPLAYKALNKVGYKYPVKEQKEVVTE